MKRSFFLLSAVAILFLAASCDTPYTEENPEGFENEASITSFYFKSVVSTSEISEPESEKESSARSILNESSEETTYTITVTVPQDTDLTCLVPEITFEGDTISPDPLTVRDWSEPVAFTVTAINKDIEPRVYTVTVVPLSSAKDWTYTKKTFADFAAETAQLAAGEYRVSFPKGTVISSSDMILIRDALSKDQKKLFRIDFTGCSFENNTLPKYAFNLPARGKGVDNLLSVVLPEGLVKIDSFAFENCKNLTSVVLPVSLQAIGEEAFLGCKKIPSIRIRKGVDLLGDWVFGHFTKEQTVVMDVSEAPETWSASWNYKCKAVIEWATPEETDEEEAVAVSEKPAKETAVEEPTESEKVVTATEPTESEKAVVTAESEEGTVAAEEPTTSEESEEE